MTHALRPKATIVAFDGLVVDSEAARAQVVAETVTAEFAPLDAAQVVPLLAGRSLDEAVEAALTLASRSRGAPCDATARDLAVLRARRSYSAIVAHGLPMCEGATTWIRARVASHGRLILRADGVRREVEQLLLYSGLDSLIAFARCADDLPRSAGMSSLENSWQAIMTRVASQGVQPADCEAFERASVCADAARQAGATVERTEALG